MQRLAQMKAHKEEYKKNYKALSYLQSSMKNYKALSYLQSSIVNNIFPRIVEATTAKQAWNILQEVFQGLEKVRSLRLQNLRKDFEKLKMKDSKIIKEYSSRFSEVMNQMKIYGESIPKDRQVLKILNTLQDKYSNTGVQRLIKTYCNWIVRIIANLWAMVGQEIWKKNEGVCCKPSKFFSRL